MTIMTYKTGSYVVPNIYSWHVHTAAIVHANQDRLNTQTSTSDLINIVALA
jgi:hypothetical protein